MSMQINFLFPNPRDLYILAQVNTNSDRDRPEYCL